VFITSTLSYCDFAFHILKVHELLGLFFLQIRHVVIHEESLQVGNSGNLEKGLLPPFSQDIHNVIHIKKPTLPGTSFELVS